MALIRDQGTFMPRRPNTNVGEQQLLFKRQGLPAYVRARSPVRDSLPSLRLLGSLARSYHLAARDMRGRGRIAISCTRTSLIDLLSGVHLPARGHYLR